MNESEPSIKRANIHDRVARLLAAASKLEFDNIDMEKILSTQKRPYRCVKRPETADTENSSDSSESIPSLPSAIVQRANINEMLASARACQIRR